ncbi:MAG: adenylate/guanylate cyclase domain-containing protein, partial [Porticoccaceae bacterium]
LNLKKNVTHNLITTLAIVFVDGIVTGLLIQFIGLHHALSVGIGGLFLLVYVKAFSAMTYAAIFGVTSALLTAGLTSFPTCNLETSIEILLLVMMGGFLLAFCLISGHQDKRLNEKLELQFETNRTLKQHVRSLSKYLSPKLSKSIIENKNGHIDAIDKPISIFFSDMQGFSLLSKQLSSEKLSWLINTYISEMSEIVFRFGGTLDKIIGDSIMVFFSDPNSRGQKNDAIACVCMAIAMREAMKSLTARWKNAGINQPPSIRMGINSGKCRVGNFGTDNKLDYTVVGTVVNLASHLESLAQPGEILITEDTFKLVRNQVKCTEKKPIDSQYLPNGIKIYSAHRMTGEQ